MTTALESTAQRARDLFCQQKLTADDRRELRGILSEQATLARNLGDMARVAWRSYMTPLGQAAPGMQVAAEERATHLRRELGYAESSELEKLLIDDIVLCQFDYYRIERTYAIATAESYSLTVMQEWDAVLSSKQARLNRAILALARVRRLLKLPAVQINVNQAGGQQLNIAGG